MKKFILSFAILLCLASITSAQDPNPTPKPPQASGGGAVMAEPLFRVVGSVAGTKLIQENGRLVIEDPRTVFYAPADKEIIVYFTWEGPPGQHHFEGLWKNPTAKVSMTSEFDHRSEQRRVGGYFKMMPGDAPNPGTWSLEARIDGEPAGSHTFEILVAPRPDNVVAAKPIRRPLRPSELYSRALAASVLVENISSKGTRRLVGTGFFIGAGKLLTAFQVIDGATKVRVVGPQGRSVEATEVLAFNRRQDWIVFNVPFEGVPPLERSVAAAPAIGDRTYFLDVPAEGNRVVVETSIIGKNTLGPGVERYNIGDTANRRAFGSPLLNEFGEVIGMVGGTPLPGSAFLEDLTYGARTSTFEMVSRGTLAVPITLVNESTTTATTLEGLSQSGYFMLPLANTQSVLSGALARTVNKKSYPPQPVDSKYEFSRSSGEGVILITWLPQEKIKGFPALRIYDLDNKLVGENINKKKITADANKLSFSLWEMNFAPLAPGIYRIDVQLDSDVVWRAFFRMLE